MSRHTTPVPTAVSDAVIHAWDFGTTVHPLTTTEVIKSIAKDLRLTVAVVKKALIASARVEN